MHHVSGLAAGGGALALQAWRPSADVNARSVLSKLRPPRAAHTLVFDFIADLHLLVSYLEEEGPTDAEWDAFVAALGSGLDRFSSFRSLVITGGAHPSRSQQARMVARGAGRTPRVAVISSSIALRFVTSALALVNRNIRCFAMEEPQRAFAHLGLEPAHHGTVEAMIESLRRKFRQAKPSELASPPPASHP